MRKFNWVPNVSLGPFVFGEKISKYEKEMGVYLEEEMCEETGFTCYKIPHTDTSLHTENEIISFITTYDFCVYKDKNLIGMTIDELELLLGKKPDEIGLGLLFENGDILDVPENYKGGGVVQYPYEYRDLNIRVWILSDAENTIVEYVSVTNDAALEGTDGI